MVVYAKLQKEQTTTEAEAEMKTRGGTKEVWLTSLILFPHTAAFQIDLHTAQCAFSLGLTVVGAPECTSQQSQGNLGRNSGEGGRKQANKQQKNPLNFTIKGNIFF